MNFARGMALAGGIAVAVLASSSANAFSLSNSNGGDGFVTGSYPSFDLFGSNNGASNNTTSYAQLMASAGSLTFNWKYTTVDCCGAGWDPGGYTINGALFQLSPQVFGSSGTGNSSGVKTISWNAGDTVGWYVFSPDSIQGRADIAISTGVPEPAAWALMLAGFGLVGATLRSRRTSAVAA